MDTKEYLDKLVEFIMENNNEIRENNGKCNFLVFEKIIEYIQIWLGEVVATSKKEIELDNFNNHINEIIAAFENGDYLLMADIFEYELIDEMKSFIA